MQPGMSGFPGLSIWPMGEAKANNESDKLIKMYLSLQQHCDLAVCSKADCQLSLQSIAPVVEVAVFAELA